MRVCEIEFTIFESSEREREIERERKRERERERARWGVSYKLQYTTLLTSIYLSASHMYVSIYPSSITI